MPDFTTAYELTGPVFSHWGRKRTERELRLHLFEVGYRLERVLQGKGKNQAQKQGDIVELHKETSDLLIILKHFALNFGGRSSMLGTRHLGFARRRTKKRGRKSKKRTRK